MLHIAQGRADDTSGDLLEEVGISGHVSRTTSAIPVLSARYCAIRDA